MIPAKFTPVVFAFFMSMLMAFIMSGVLTFVNLGAIPNFFARWMHAFVIAWCCAFPTVLLVAPIARKIVSKLVVSTPLASKTEKS
jgi:hypothetical protein